MLTHTHKQVRTILIPSSGQPGVPIQSSRLSPSEMSLIFEAIARSLSIQTQDVSLHLWSLTGAAAPKRLRADIEHMQRDIKAMGEQLKGILALNTAEILHTTFQVEYVTDHEE